MSRVRFSPTLLTTVLFVLLAAAASIRYQDQHFLSARTMADLVSGNAFVGVMAVGMTLVILSGGIDLSVGAVMGLCNITVAVLIMRWGWPALPALLAAPVLGAVIGGGQGLLIRGSRLPPFIITLAGLFLARGAGYLVSLESVGIDDEGHARLAALGITVAEARLSVSTLLFIGVAGLAVFITRRTPFGRTIYAVGGSEEAAALMGLPVARTQVAIYAISGACAGLAGAMLSLDLSSGSHSEGTGLELDAIAAVVIGGTLLTGGAGSVAGTVVGVLLMGLVVNIATAYEGWLSSGLTKVVIAGLLAVFVVLQRVIGRDDAGRER
ncbi:MAG: sugar ABC transporter permease YjfF [Phycisphaerales bacterium]|nr:sugar ABC transporter permease YjfF [Phycisphaerales bacterium]